MIDQFGSPSDEGMALLRKAWEKAQRDEPQDPVETQLRAELAKLEARLDVLELKISRLPAGVWDLPRRYL
jgi:hypothetical protein